MFKHVESEANERKFRLFYIALCQPFIHLMTDPRSRRAVDVGEQYADRLVVEDVRIECFLAAKQVVEEARERLGTDTEPPPEVVAAVLAQFPCVPVPEDAEHAEQVVQEYGFLWWLTDPANLEERKLPMIRTIWDIFGNPFQPVAFDPRWRSPDAVALARGIYEDRAFDGLPLLTDALMDAGCDDEQVIGHCRTYGPHVRGCWVVDLVLGKE